MTYLASKHESIISCIQVKLLTLLVKSEDLPSEQVSSMGLSCNIINLSAQSSAETNVNECTRHDADSQASLKRIACVRFRGVDLLSGCSYLPAADGRGQQFAASFCRADRRNY